LLTLPFVLIIFVVDIRTGKTYLCQGIRVSEGEFPSADLSRIGHYDAPERESLSSGALTSRRSLPFSINEGTIPEVTPTPPHLHKPKKLDF